MLLDMKQKTNKLWINLLALDVAEHIQIMHVQLGLKYVENVLKQLPFCFNL